METKKVTGHISVLIITVLAIVLDQFTKHLAVVHLKDSASIVLIPGVFELRYLENRGAAFGMMQNQQLFFIIITCCVMIALLYFYIKVPMGRRYYLMKACMILLCAGAVGNLIDRVVNNYVVDFFYFSLINFPIFNVADCYVVVACFLFAYLILFYYKDEELSCFSIRKQDKKGN